MAQVTTIRAASLEPFKYHTHGPLYESIKLLIADEQFNAELISKDTMESINMTTNTLLEQLDQLHGYNQVILHKMEKFLQLSQQQSIRKCFKLNEQEIAHFDRELIYKYDACLQTVERILDKLSNETIIEVEFIQGAAAQIAQVPAKCNLKSLRSHNTEQAAVVLCVATDVGQIKQRLFETSELFLDFLADISFANDEEGIGSITCRSFIDLQQQFNTIYSELEKCVADNS